MAVAALAIVVVLLLAGIATPTELWPALVHAAGFHQMRVARKPARAGPVSSCTNLARSSATPATATGKVVTLLQLARCHTHATTLAPPGLLSLLHR